MAVKARMLFEFEGDTENGELVLKEGDIVTVLNKDIGDGWWEGETASGVTGLFPESYCEELQTTEDGEGAVQNGEAATYEWDDQDDWDNQEQRSAQPTDNTGYDYTEDRASVGGGSTSRTISPGNQSTGITGRHGTVKKNINRFSPFVKTGTEGFVLHNITVKRDVKQTERISVVLSRDEECPMWRPPSNPFTIEVKDPEKKKKFKGIKSFVAYQVIPSNTSRPVSRRYKHYDWLHDRLMEKFTILSVPPLPDKRYQSKFGEEFVEKRRAKLEMWTNRVARHPVLSNSDVFQHFITCGDADQGEWKAGKRRAEKDELVGGALFLTVDTSVAVDVRQIEGQMEGFGQFRKSMEENCIKLRDRMMIHCNTMAGPFLQEWHRMAAAIHGLGQCFQQENKDYAKGLNQAIGFTADTYREIGTMHSVQPKNDTLPALDVLKEYLGLLHEFPDTTDMYKGCLSKVKDCERMKEEGRIDIVEAGEIQERSEKVASVLQAEMFHFQRERVIDFRQMMREMLQEQITFYKDITGKLESALEKYNEDTSL